VVDRVILGMSGADGILKLVLGAGLFLSHNVLFYIEKAILQ